MDDGSCNHMVCAICGSEFCWLCMKEISDLHYLSPSGCTFWGKKPWSRKKKLLWQLGTLVGAPLGIALVAGIAVPAMIIGIPVWVGRKIHTRYKSAGKHKRNFAVLGGVTASVSIVITELQGLTFDFKMSTAFFFYRKELLSIRMLLQHHGKSLPILMSVFLDCEYHIQ
uniref:RING-type domain-containing protein n=1 Tax=Anopheles maculatus TaxID=74869 RepID=A0A182T0B2_9DIPT